MHLYPKQILAQICPQSLDPPTFFCWDIFTFQVAWSDRFSDDANFESLVKPEANPSSEKHKKSCLSQHRSSPFPSRFPQQMSVLSYSCVSLTSALSDRNGQQSFFVCQGPETNFIHEWFHLSPSLQTSTRGCHFPPAPYKWCWEGYWPIYRSSFRGNNFIKLLSSLSPFSILLCLKSPRVSE